MLPFLLTPNNDLDIQLNAHSGIGLNFSNVLLKPNSLDKCAFLSVGSILINSFSLLSTSALYTLTILLYR